MSMLDSWEISHTITLLKVGVGSRFSVKSPLMEVWNIWAFLTSTGPVGPFGLIISYIPILVGEVVVPLPIRTEEFNLRYLMGVLPSCGVVPSLPDQVTPPGVRKTRAPLRAVSVTINFEAGVWRVCVFPLPDATPSEIRRSIVRMMTGRIRFINIFVEIFCW